MCDWFERAGVGVVEHASLGPLLLKEESVGVAEGGEGEAINKVGDLEVE